MSIIDLLWIFLILSSLQPVIRPRWLEAQRLRAFRQLEASQKTAQRRPSVECIPLPDGPAGRRTGSPSG
ncbi:MAG: hypothetical protein ACXWMU_03575 [Candidatus Limnocylindrales bacterium]